MSDTATIENEKRFKSLRKRAATLGLRIIVDDEIVDEDMAPEFRGPYTLADANSKYWAHSPGVNLDLLEIQITQIETEDPETGETGS
jgi:hypothetical protein